MNFEKVRAAVSTVADVGVFVGFIMVAFQLQQNTAALDAQAKAVMTSSLSAAETTMIGEDGATAFARSVTVPSELTDSQIVELWAYYASSAQPSVSAFQAYKLGLISRSDYLEQVDAFAGVYLTTDFARIWWANTKNGFFAPELIGDIDAALSRLERPDLAIEQFRAIRRDLIALQPR